MTYQKDIDGLRAIAVMAVVFFHLGLLTHGYLGVDVFFVISGYLITSKIISEEKFSIRKFYSRRIRRILPLALFIAFIAILIGYFFMLPDDLENLAQSVIASNFSINNLLLYYTTGDYWNVANEYKPLMHTWSLGVEEQFYFLYPFIFLLIPKLAKQKITITILFLLSLLLFFYIDNKDFVFFIIITRFWEIAFGGIIALYFSKIVLDYKIKTLIAFLLIVLFFLLDYAVFPKIGLFFCVFLAGVLMLHSNNDKKLFYNNTIFNFIGQISFSVYLWHQLLLAFYRYTVTANFSIYFILAYLVCTIGLSYLTYIFIENYYRNSKKVAFAKVLVFTLFLLIFSTTFSLYTIYRKGIVRDIAELGIKKENYKTIVHHNEYNDRIRKLTSYFSTDSSKAKVLLFGDSYARDFGNILLESNSKENIDLRYLHYDKKDTAQFLQKADLVLFNREEGLNKSFVDSVVTHHRISNYYVIGSKKFGDNMGVYYNRASKENCNLTAEPDERIATINQQMKASFGNVYIDLMQPVLTANNKVIVFTENCYFLSQDTKHLTKHGAQFYANKLNSIIKSILNSTDFE